jgi:hypothetical protein
MPVDASEGSGVRRRLLGGSGETHGLYNIEGVGNSVIANHFFGRVPGVGMIMGNNGDRHEGCCPYVAVRDRGIFNFPVKAG